MTALLGALGRGEGPLSHEGAERSAGAVGCGLQLGELAIGQADRQGPVARFLAGRSADPGRRHGYSVADVSATQKDSVSVLRKGDFMLYDNAMTTTATHGFKTQRFASTMMRSTIVCLCGNESHGYTDKLATIEFRSHLADAAEVQPSDPDGFATPEDCALYNDIIGGRE